LHGRFECFDDYIVAVRNTVTQLVYKHAISTVVPAGSEDARAGVSEKPSARTSVIVRTKATLYMTHDQIEAMTTAKQ
jgi:hypothetical protein